MSGGCQIHICIFQLQGLPFSPVFLILCHLKAKKHEIKHRGFQVHVFFCYCWMAIKDAGPIFFENHVFTLGGSSKAILS